MTLKSSLSLLVPNLIKLARKLTVKSDMKKMTLTNSTQNKLLQERINAVEKQNTAMKLEMNRLNVEVGSC